MNYIWVDVITAITPMEGSASAVQKPFLKRFRHFLRAAFRAASIGAHRSKHGTRGPHQNSQVMWKRPRHHVLHIERDPRRIG
jgi:hypothetical protein